MSAVIMRPPSGFSGTLQGMGANYSADASGNYSILFYKDVQTLLAAGWSPVVSGTETTPDFLVDLTGINPPAAVSTYGTVQNIAPGTDFGSIKPLSCDIVFGGTFGTETVTVQIVVTFSDGTTHTTTTFTATGTGTTAMTNAQLRSTFYKNAVTITNIAINSKSSLAAGSSIATVEVKMHGIQA